MGSNVQVVWEKFCRYFDVEPRYLPMEKGRYVITPEQVLENVDEDTIGVVAILGTTFTGELEPIGDICAALDKLAADGEWMCRCTSTPPAGLRGALPPSRPGMGLPAAAGGVDQRQRAQVRPDLPGHRLRGVAQRTPARRPGLPGELSRRRHADLHAEFLRPGNQVVGQYYNFLRLGRAEYSQVMGCLSQTARWLGDQLRESQHFELISDGSAIPVVSFRLARRSGYTEFDVSHALRAYGWQVPAYTMPDNATDIAVLRVVVREGFSADLARALRDDIVTALGQLDALKPGGQFDELQPFAHCVQRT